VEVITCDDFLTEEQKEQIDQYFSKGALFPMFLTNQCVRGDGIPNMSHTVVARKDYGQDKVSLESRIESSSFYFWMSVLEAFLDKTGVEVKGEILRIAVNGSFAVHVERGVFHTDEQSDYKHLLVYLNDDFTGTGRTILQNEDGTEEYIEPKKFRGAFFGKCLHTLEYPTSGMRLIAVYTFN
jgi:hypothetical protein